VQFVIRVYCSDGRSKQQDLDNHTFLGETRAILSNLMCASNQLLCSDLTGGRETWVFFCRKNVHSFHICLYVPVACIEHMYSCFILKRLHRTLIPPLLANLGNNFIDSSFFPLPQRSPGSARRSEPPYPGQLSGNFCVQQTEQQRRLFRHQQSVSQVA